MMQNIQQESNKRGFFTLLFGCRPTVAQKAYFWFMMLSLLVWPLFLLVAAFLFDAPIRSNVDETCRIGMALTIVLYPLYLLPLIGLWFRLSKLIRATWLYYLCPLIPIAVFFVFLEIDSSEYAARKPEGYDASTFVRLNEAFAKDINHVYYYNEILKEADPKSFRALNDVYSADNRHVWYRENKIDGANPQSFVAPEKKNSFDLSVDLAHDDHDYYSGETPLHVVDMASFKRKNGSWAIDRHNIYYIGIEAKIGKDIVPIGDYQSFRALNDFYAADAKYVYYKSEIVEGADPKKFAPLYGENNYGKDENRVRLDSRLVKDFLTCSMMSCSAGFLACVLCFINA